MAVQRGGVKKKGTSTQNPSKPAKPSPRQAVGGAAKRASRAKVSAGSTKTLSTGKSGGIKRGGVKRKAKPVAAAPKPKPKAKAKPIRKRPINHGGRSNPEGEIRDKGLSTAEQQSGGRAGLHGRPKEFMDEKNYDKIRVDQTNKQKAENKERDDWLREKRKKQPTKSLKQRKADADKKYKGLSKSERAKKSLADLKAQRAKNKANTGKGGDRIKTGTPKMQGIKKNLKRAKIYSHVK